MRLTSGKQFLLSFVVLYVSLSFLNYVLGLDPLGLITITFFYTILGGLNIFFDLTWLRATLWSIFMEFPVGLIYLLAISDPGLVVYLEAHSPIFAETIFLFFDQKKNQWPVPWRQVILSGLLWFSYSLILYILAPWVYPAHYYLIMFTTIICCTSLNALYWRFSNRI